MEVSVTFHVEVVNISDINQVWSSRKDSFLAALKEHILIITVKDTCSPPWIDNEILGFKKIPPGQD